MIVSSLFFGVIQGRQWGNISTAQEQHSDQILAKYENIGKLKKVEWLTPVVDKKYFINAPIFVVMCLLKQQCDAVGMVTSPSLQRFIAV